MFNFWENKKGRSPDYLLVVLIFILTVFGLIMLSSASSDLGKIKFNDTYYYLKHQIFYGLSIGIAGFFIFSHFYYKNLKKIAVPLLIINIIFLFLVFTPLGFAHKGASRWIDIGPFSFQPAEFLKLSFIIYFAAWLSNKKFNRLSFTQGFLPLMAIFGFISLLIVMQPATTILLIIIGSAMAMYFVSGAKIWHMALIILIGAVGLALVIYATPYRYERIAAFFGNDFEKQETSRYQLNQSLSAIGNGGFFGVGFGKSTTKYKYLPEPIGDSIFAVIAEELGFVGFILLISIFTAFFIKCFLIAKNSGDPFAKLVIIGFISVISIQTFIHIAAISGLMPLTGVPLPFISYGGTSLAVFLTMAGIIVNISKYS